MSHRLNQSELDVVARAYVTDRYLTWSRIMIVCLALGLIAYGSVRGVIEHGRFPSLAELKFTISVRPGALDKTFEASEAEAHKYFWLVFRAVLFGLVAFAILSTPKTFARDLANAPKLLSAREVLGMTHRKKTQTSPGHRLDTSSTDTFQQTRPEDLQHGPMDMPMMPEDQKKTEKAIAHATKRAASAPWIWVALSLAGGTFLAGAIVTVNAHYSIVMQCGWPSSPQAGAACYPYIDPELGQRLVSGASITLFKALVDTAGFLFLAIISGIAFYLLIRQSKIARKIWLGHDRSLLSGRWMSGSE